MTLPAPVNAPSDPGRPGPEELLAGYLAAQRARDAGNRRFSGAARVFLGAGRIRRPGRPNHCRTGLAANSSTRPLLNHLMLFGYLHPGYDYLLERRLQAVLREAKGSPMAADLNRFLAAAAELGFTSKTAAGMASQIAMRMLIQTGRRLVELTEDDIAVFDAAMDEREATRQRSFKHYRAALRATRTVLYHLGAPVAAPIKDRPHLRGQSGRHLIGVPEAITRSLAAYLECAAGTRTSSTVDNIDRRLGQFARFIAHADPALASLAGLDRQRHIEPYLAAVAAARHPRHRGAAFCVRAAQPDPDRRPDDR